MSDKVTIDLSNYKDRVGSRIAEGTYRVLVEDAERTEAKSGNTMINLFLRVQGGEFDGATIVDRLVLTEKSLFRVVAFLQALGLPTPKKRLQLGLDKFIGKQLDVQVEDGEPYNGRVKSEVRGYARITKSEKQSEADLEDLGSEEETTDSLTDPMPEGVEESSEDVDLDSIENL